MIRSKPRPHAADHASHRPAGWSQIAALGYVAARPLGRIAVEEDWIAALVEFVMNQCRLPDGREIPSLKRKAADIAQRCDWILGDADASGAEKVMAKAVMDRRSGLVAFVLSKPDPRTTNDGDAA